MAWEKIDEKTFVRKDYVEMQRISMEQLDAEIERLTRELERLKALKRTLENL